MLKLIRVDMERRNSPFGTYHLPKVRVRFRRDGEWSSGLYTALIDSGAAYTLVTWSLAKTLGIPDGEILNAPTAPWGGAAGLSGTAYRLTMDMMFGPGTSDETRCLVLEKAAVCVTKEGLPFDILVGQLDALSRLKLFHTAQTPKASFALAHPDVPAQAG